jgi:hypothetical protein
VKLILKRFQAIRSKKPFPQRWNFYLLVLVPHDRTWIFFLSQTCQEDLSTDTQPGSEKNKMAYIEGRVTKLGVSLTIKTGITL